MPRKSIAIILAVVSTSALAYLAIYGKGMYVVWVLLVLSLLASAMLLGPTRKLARSLSQFVGKQSQVKVWGLPIPPDSESTILKVESIRGFGAGLLIRLRPSMANESVLLKVAQPRGLSTGAEQFHIADAAYVSWAGTKIPRRTGEIYPAVSVFLRDKL